MAPPAGPSTILARREGLDLLSRVKVSPAVFAVLVPLVIIETERNVGMTNSVHVLAAVTFSWPALHEGGRGGVS